MQFIPSVIPDVLIIEPKIYGDKRGYFFESFRKDIFSHQIPGVDFVQDNESMSVFGVLRGLHYQLPPLAQNKLVRVITGLVLDVSIDIRKGSPTFGKHVTVKLSGENKRQVFIPKGFAHGFLVLSKEAVFQYKVDKFYSAEHERGIAFDDPSLGIAWGLTREKLILSDKDMSNPSLVDAEIFGYGGT